MSEEVKPTTHPLFAKVKAADYDPATGEVVLKDGVNPKYLVQDLVREMAALQQQIGVLKKVISDQKEIDKPT